eukprot:scaffold955_cov325-Prasinococcus_capsulatus_cf.AAC.3
MVDSLHIIFEYVEIRDANAVQGTAGAMEGRAGSRHSIDKACQVVERPQLMRSCYNHGSFMQAASSDSTARSPNTRSSSKTARCTTAPPWPLTARALTTSGIPSPASWTGWVFPTPWAVTGERATW